MAKVLEGKVAVVTGAGRGIGRGEAMALAAAGAKVVVNDLGGAADGTGGDAAPANVVVNEIKAQGGAAVSNFDSVSDPDGAEKIIQTAINNFGRIDILINNAGILRDRMVFNMTNEEWDIVQKVHMYGHFYCTRSACKYMRQQKWGRIVNTSSSAGLGETFGQANYGAAKEGIVGLTRQVARDMGRYGVTCNALRPSAATRLTMTPELKEAWKKAGQDILVERLEALNPEDIAPLVVFLCTDAASNINGRTFAVGGGEISLYTEPIKERTIYKIGRWTVEELLAIGPSTIGKDVINPGFEVK
ncbi:MAG: SDR family oxidoreductase [Candidatus Tectomicrobia bacterium]|uniref:SDR family oxidoreductase n=1 Tax=Tectimicrobiota bacterium TaxID=2528274 RepID=A0A933LQV1_UNCTE|nr:SDR family oxidoreductase [Candidatus Tectomicrobia bacterium]